MLTGTIREARIVPLPFSTAATLVVTGRIYDDAKGRFEDGTEIRTSKIMSGPDADNIVVTRNSIYRVELANG